MARHQDEENARAEKRAARVEHKRRISTSGLGSSAADWASVNGDVLARAVAAVARDGGALRLGYTRDGGAYAIGIYGDGDPYTEYIPPSESVEEFLGRLTHAYTE